MHTTFELLCIKFMNLRRGVKIVLPRVDGHLFQQVGGAAIQGRNLCDWLAEKGAGW